MKLLKNRVLWISMGALVTLAFAALYVVIQQSLRIGANEPQASMARRISAQLQNGKSTTELTPGKIDLSSDTAPFVIIYDQYGKVVKGNGYLLGSVPQVPIGVLASAKAGKLNAVTWQPEKNVRIASVSAQAGNQYVLVGRSLSVIEHKIQTVGWWLLGFWILTLVTALTTCRLLYRPVAKSQPAAKD